MDWINGFLDVWTLDLVFSDFWTLVFLDFWTLTGFLDLDYWFFWIWTFGFLDLDWFFVDFGFGK